MEQGSKSPPAIDTASPDGSGNVAPLLVAGHKGLLARIPFMRSASDHKTPPSNDDEGLTSHAIASPAGKQPSAMASALQQQMQQKTRRRRGSLRKVALLGRGAQRERRESKPSSPGLDRRPQLGLDTAALASVEDGDLYGLGISDITPRPSMEGYASRTAHVISATSATLTVSPPTDQPQDQPFPLLQQQPAPGGESGVTSPAISYSTTDDEDILQISTGGITVGGGIRVPPAPPSLSSGSDSYFASRSGFSELQRRRFTTAGRAKSPLALGGLAATPLPGSATDPEWDYAETERWGWVVLLVTWVFFIVGMGSCLGVWSWAWDVGTTPYAPPELEDDPTLPIIGYYPALIILTGVMAWVWVVVAWVGMKYFRHAKISGD